MTQLDEATVREHEEALASYRAQLDEVRALREVPGSDSAELVELEGSLLEVFVLQEELLREARAAALTTAEAPVETAAAPAEEEVAIEKDLDPTYFTDGPIGPEKPDAGASGTEVYRGVPEPKRVRALNSEEAALAVEAELPKSMQIQPGDDEVTRERKRRQAKTFKGRQRLAMKDNQQNAKQSSWQAFRAGTGSKRKKGFFSANSAGVTKTSMFAVPDNLDGKVGVTGSGSGVSEVAERRRHEYSSAV